MKKIKKNSKEGLALSREFIKGRFKACQRFFNNRERSLAAGFTLAEMMVVIFIISVMLAIISLNYGGISKGSKFEGTILKIISDTRKAQNYSLGLRHHDDEFPKSGWGVYFKTGETGEYEIFANENEEGDNFFNKYTEVKKNSLSRVVYVENIYIFTHNDTGEIEECVADKDNVYLTYSPPNPDILVCYEESGNMKCKNGEDFFNKVILKFGTTDDSKKCLLFNQFGLVDFINCSVAGNACP